MRATAPTALALIVLLTMALTLPLSLFEPWRQIEDRAFDWLSTATMPVADAGSAVIVGIDEPSFAEIGRAWPWPRSLHANLVRSLAGAGARVIVFDVLFAEPSDDPEQDLALEQAIADAGNVVLAADETMFETSHIAQLLRTDPLERLARVSAGVGLAAVPLDRDTVLRRIPQHPDALARVALGEQSAEAPLRLRLLDPAQGFPYASYYQALDPGRFLPPDFFRDRLVIIGLNLKTSADPRSRIADTFATSLTARTGELMPGPMVHANIAESLRRGLAVRDLPDHVAALAPLSAILLTAFLLLRWHPVAGGIGTAGIAAAFPLLAYLLLEYERIWLPPLLPALAALLTYLARGAHAYLVAMRDRLRIKQAFARYLAPALVEELARDASRLRLGGEMREMTILFCDVRGFTTLSEAFRTDPQGLTRLINRFLTPMTEIILRHGGTIDKYIGDCIMAFWNAPLSNPAHARLACDAALAMIAGIHPLNESLAARAQEEGSTFAPLAIGIGINTGPCVVGNMGSEQRFDYSVLGDAVNLASRLEGQSKAYGVSIVIGPDTAAAIPDHAVIELDLLAVKGKREAVRIFALVGGSDRARDRSFREMREAQRRMLAAYRSGNWAAARRELAQARGLAPDLGALFDLYEERISAYELAPPPPDWNGVHVATTK